MTAQAVGRLLLEVTQGWLADPAADVIWAGDYAGRRGVRLRLSEGDPATVWFEVRDWSLGVEALVLSGLPAAGREEVYRQALARNAAGRRLHLALDLRGDLVLVGRVPLKEVDGEELELLLGEAQEALEIARPALARAAFGREKKR